jgi:hypothetical protein
MLAVAACAAPGTDTVDLSNSSGKDDSVAIRVKLTDASPVAGFAIGCDQMPGCDGHIGITLKTPEPCALFPSEQRCGIARTQPLALEVLKAEIVSSTEGTRSVPLRVETGDGLAWNKAAAAGFTANGSEEVEVTLTKTPGTPDVTIEVRAEWKSKVDPSAEITALTTFLGTVPGLTYQEIATQSAGYRAFLLTYEQPVDHGNPMAGTFKQQIVLHHRAKAAPMILYTSGYALFEYDGLSELGESLQANQLSTEQRWFGPSKPEMVTPESWNLVNIEQAAKDHHRIVQALEPFYSGKWLSTGHSKGGMTSIFHRRFFPMDIDATVAYVAPISFAYPDPRYAPFLDHIGEEQCRTAIRTVQKNALMNFDAILAQAQAAHGMTAKFTRSGGLASALEKDIVALEWSFWQYASAAECAPFLTAPTDATGIYNLLAQWTGVGAPDEAYEDPLFLAYQWQAATQLGMQSYATGHLAGLLKYESIQINQAPTGTMPVHNRAAMDDIQNWVKTEASQMLFIYGESDPWSGGAYEIGTRADVMKFVAPKRPHAAMLKDLTDADREAVLAKIEQWIGARPAIGAGPTPHVPMPWMR